jgi:hypothetical protein
MFIEREDKHEIKNTGHVLLRTLNFYIPPAYSKGGEELPRADHSAGPYTFFVKRDLYTALS